jgi:hypothetical protein
MRCAWFAYVGIQRRGINSTEKNLQGLPSIEKKDGWTHLMGAFTLVEATRGGVCLESGFPRSHTRSRSDASMRAIRPRDKASET